MPNRILRGSIIDSRAFNSLSDSAQIFFYRLISIVDDFGRFEADPELLRGALFKRQLDQWPIQRVAEALSECFLVKTEDGMPLVLVYRSRNRGYLEIQNFGQRIRPKTKSKCPEPVLDITRPAPTVRDVVMAIREPVDPVDLQGIPDPPDCAGSAGGTRADAGGAGGTRADAAGRGHLPPSRARTPPPPPPPPPPISSEGGAGGNGIAIIQHGWQRDETFEPFVAEYKSSGYESIDEDFEDAHWSWKKLDFEQKLAVTKALRYRVEHGIWDDPRYIPKPRKFIDSEWKRPVPSRSLAKPPTKTTGMDRTIALWEGRIAKGESPL